MTRHLRKMLLFLLAACSAAAPVAVDASPNKYPEDVKAAYKRGKHSVRTIELDSANKGEASKSWTSDGDPQEWNSGFLSGLKWTDYGLGDYVLRTGKIYGKWVAAMQFVKDGHVLLTEYTPPYEYIDIVDLGSGHISTTVVSKDANKDGVAEIAFVHRKLDDRNYHLYTVYALEKDAPRLLWKSGGGLGDWLHGSAEGARSGAYLKAGTTAGK